MFLIFHNDQIKMKVNKKIFYLIFLICVAASASYVSPTGCTPYGVRIALGRSFFSSTENEILSVWFNTQLECPKSFIIIEKQSSIRKIYCQSKKVSFDNYTSFVQRCSINFLNKGESFQYQAYGWSGAQQDTSVPFTNSNIKARLINDDDEVKMLVLADWSYLSLKANVYDRLDSAFDNLLKSSNQPDIVYMGGDYAYDFSSNNGLNYDNFLIMMSQISSKWPCIMNTGNHEYKTPNDYMLFTSTFQLYNLTINNITVINLGSFDFILLDPYGIIFENASKIELVNKFKDHLQHTGERKPVVVASHYPLACSGSSQHCKQEKIILKPFFDLMIDYDTVLYIGAHYHTYERLYPFTKQGEFLAVPPPYTLTKSTNYLISVVEGIAGNDKSIVDKYDKVHNYTAALSYNQTGYGLASIGNKELKYEHFSAKNTEKALDSVTIIFNQLFKTNLRED